MKTRERRTFPGLFGVVLLLALLPSCRAALVPADVVPSTAENTPSTSETSEDLKTPPGPTASPTLTPTASPLLLPSDQAGSLDVPKITMDIMLNHLDRRLQVTQDVLLANTSSDLWDEVVFSVMPAHRPGVFILDRVEVTTISLREPASTVLDGTMLHVAMPAPVHPGEPISISLTYGIRIPQIEPTTRLPEGNLGAGEQVIQVGDWHPTLVPYLADTGWQLWSYHPVGDPTIYPIADYDVRLTADPQLVVAAPGIETVEGSVRRYRLPSARCFAFLASTDYHMIVDNAAGISLRSYYLPGYASAGQAALDNAARAIEIFDEFYGPYPTTGLVIAQNAYNGSMEYTGLVSMSGQAYQVYNESPRALLVSLIAHETAHQWWYGAVGNDQVHEPWLDEALAKYSELLFYERYAPDATRWWWENHVYQYEPEGPMDRTIYDFDTTPKYVQQIYGQGARFLADLRGQMGDEAFFGFLRDYRHRGEGRLMTREAFFTVLRTRYEGDLQSLIEPYFSIKPEASNGAGEDSP